MSEKIFVNGLISKDVPETAPEFILGKLSVKVSELSKWLNDNKGIADNDWINLTVMRSKITGKRYIEVDTYKPKTPVLDTVDYGDKVVPEGKGIDVSEFEDGAVNVDDNPF